MKSKHFPWKLILAFLLLWVLVSKASEYIPANDFEEDQIQIIEGENRIIYEYRQNGVLMMIKVVPKRGRPYYMVPAESGSHHEGLDHKRKLYPQWVILEW